MDEKIIIKPTDYVVEENGEIGYSYPYEEQYKDGERLNNLTKKDLLMECKNRWREVEELPVPSKISRYALARDLAFAKGYVSSEEETQSKEDQREF